ncbi:hypothetical protein ACHQM5_026564 [Ranunculus cassubicifolius]
MFHLLQHILVIIIIIAIADRTVLLTSAGLSYNCVPKPPSSCANGLQINYPFWIDDGSVPSDTFCQGYPPFQIKCASDGRPVLNISNHLYYVQNMDLDSQRLTALDVDIDEQDCPQPQRNVSIASARFLKYDDQGSNMTIFYNCSASPKDVEQQLPCLQSNYNNTMKHSYGFAQDQIPKEFVRSGNCEENVVVPVSVPYGLFYTNANYTQALKRGFLLDWSWPVDCQDCVDSGGQCSENMTTSNIHCKCSDGTTMIDRLCSSDRPKASGLSIELKIIIGTVTGVVAVFLVLLLIYWRTCCSSYYLVVSKWRRMKNPTNLEVFLESYGNLSLQRYKYSEIKKMTNLFKETLGKGGFGSVYKGTLQDGRLVAVKVLNEYKGDGEDFINEVNTIGRTNHVNVVSLLGFSIEGTKRALVYEFMPNGSLERFIYSQKESSTTNTPPLEREKLYEIAVGIARGLDYLHRGCNTRILHFDIKPHNILLDQEFRPKISDFGLAKLSAAGQSVMSMDGARGTVGYIAPELCYLGLGGVSHKSDVYSYGMMVLEMIAGRKNIDDKVHNTSEIFFPEWIFNRLRLESKEGDEDEKFEDEISRKMGIVALWCIQVPPADRPPISKVVEMLEGKADELQMPPNPSLDPYFRSTTESKSLTNSTESI